MSLLQCSQCQKDISATHKHCPHCGVKISFWGEVKNNIEKSRLRQVGVVLVMFFLLGTTWFVGKNTGHRWPLYMLVILCAPVVPWLLQLAYKNAAPVTEGAEDSPNNTIKNAPNDARNGIAQDPDDPSQKIWRG